MRRIEGSFDVDLDKTADGIVSTKICGVVTTIPFLCEVKAVTAAGEGPPEAFQNIIGK